MSYTNDFERGKDPKRSMGIGRPPTIQQLLEELFEEYLLKFSDDGKIDFYCQDDFQHSKFGPGWCDTYFKATILCKSKKSRNRIKDMVSKSEFNQGKDFTFWDSVFDLVQEQGYESGMFTTSLDGFPFRKGIKVHLEFE